MSLEYFVFTTFFPPRLDTIQDFLCESIYVLALQMALIIFVGLTMTHSRSQQRTDQRVLVHTLKFLALKKTGFSPVKSTSQKVFDFFLPLFYATF